MFSQLCRRFGRTSSLVSTRKPRLEHLEDRRVLSGTQADIMADIVFLVDESASNSDVNAQDWLRALVTGDVDNDGNTSDPEDTLSLADQLSAVGINDVRYGLVGFGQFDSAENPRYAHSQLFPTAGDPDALFGTPSDFTTAQLNTFFGTFPSGNLAQFGGTEDGWDAIEHAIAEYEIRDGAVPVFVLVQNDEGRIPGSLNQDNDPIPDINNTLSHTGVLSALQSKNAILNVITAGPSINDGAQHNPLFDLIRYGGASSVRILGVEADTADGARDWAHDYHAVEVNTPHSTSVTAGQTTSKALQVSFDGSNTGATGMVGTGKSLLIGENLSGGIGESAGEYRAQTYALAA